MRTPEPALQDALGQPQRVARFLARGEFPFSFMPITYFIVKSLLLLGQWASLQMIQQESGCHFNGPKRSATGSERLLGKCLSSLQEEALGETMKGEGSPSDRSHRKFNSRNYDLLAEGNGEEN